MVLRCGVCGSMIEIDGRLVDGQHVHCPHCGEVSSYQTPARAEELNPAAERKLYMVEERARMYEDMKHKKWRRKVIGNIVSVVILLSIPLVGWHLYKEWSDYRDRQRKDAEMRLKAEQEELERAERLRREQQEMARLEREAKKAREKEERERAEAEKKKAEIAKRLAAEKYRVLTIALRENDFDLFNPNVTNRLAETGGELCYCLPKEGDAIPLYCVVYSTNGTVAATQIDKDGAQEPLDMAVLQAKMQGRSYIVASGDKVYFRSRQRNKRSGALDVGREVDPSTLFFGDLNETMSALKPVYDELTFDIVFSPKDNPQKQIVCENVEFGCTYSLSKVHEAVEKEYPPPVGGGGRFRVQRFRRTAKLWNGSHIKQGIDGVTYVPRVMPEPRPRNSYNGLAGNVTIWHTGTRRGDPQNYAQWQSLYERAVREDNEEAAYYARQRQLHEAQFADRRSAAENAYVEKIERIIREGRLCYRIRKAKKGRR